MVTTPDGQLWISNQAEKVVLGRVSRCDTQCTSGDCHAESVTWLSPTAGREPRLRGRIVSMRYHSPIQEHSAQTNEPNPGPVSVSSEFVLHFCITLSGLSLGLLGLSESRGFPPVPGPPWLESDKQWTARVCRAPCLAQGVRDLLQRGQGQ